MYEAIYNPAKMDRPFWCTVPLQCVYKWLITQAMAKYVTINVSFKMTATLWRALLVLLMVRQSIVA